MRIPRLLPSLASIVVLASGCASYQYRILQPPTAQATISDEPAQIVRAPLTYTFARARHGISLSISNTTPERIILSGEKSYVIDPQGESHPVAGSAIGPHSYFKIEMPPVPVTSETTLRAGGWIFTPRYAGGFMTDEPVFYSPPVTTTRFWTAYDWHWNSGVAKLRLSYEQNGKGFDQDSEIAKEKAR